MEGFALIGSVPFRHWNDFGNECFRNSIIPVGFKRSLAVVKEFLRATVVAGAARPTNVSRSRGTVRSSSRRQFETQFRRGEALMRALPANMLWSCFAIRCNTGLFVEMQHLLGEGVVCGGLRKCVFVATCGVMFVIVWLKCGPGFYTQRARHGLADPRGKCCNGV